MDCEECYTKMMMPPCKTCPNKNFDKSKYLYIDLPTDEQSQAMLDELMKNWYCNFTFTNESIPDIGTITTNIPDIIHCEECRHFHQEIVDGIHYFNFDTCEKGISAAHPRFYCAYGERKDD